MNGTLVWEGYFCFDGPKRRGVNLLLIDPSTCTLRDDPKTFETNNLDSGNPLTPMVLVEYLEDNLMQGDVVVGVSFDEAFWLMNATLTSAIREHLGIEFGEREWNGTSFAFIAQKGFLSKKVLDTRTKKESKTNTARLKIAVTGTDLDIALGVHSCSCNNTLHCLRT